MKKTTPLSILMFFCFVTSLLYLWHDTAQAARIGRSRSFGSRPSYQRSAPAPAQNPSTTQARPAPGTQPGMTAPGSRWGGMLGGFVMGGLLGSLLFGGGHGFGGPGLMDLLLIGGGLMLLMRFLRARQVAPQPSAPASLYSGSGQGWGQSGFTPAGDQPPPPPALPPGFDAEEFQKGATIIFNRLQTSWDKRDLDDIRQFTSPEVLAEIQRQAQEEPHPGKTEVLMVNCRVVEVRDIDHQTVVSVLYDAMLREDGDRTAKQVREMWHFSRDARRPEDFWILEGIQQVE
jgi:predicted lipid-binding transport protein (Tim44 family)